METLWGDAMHTQRAIWPAIESIAITPSGWGSSTVRLSFREHDANRGR